MAITSTYILFLLKNPGYAPEFTSGAKMEHVECIMRTATIILLPTSTQRRKRR